MAKIILAKGETVLQEMYLSKERITIGRRTYNDIVINDLAISGEHAVIVTEKGDSFLEDLNSTNGTQINGQPVRKHFLRSGDVVEMAQYRLQYCAEQCEEVVPRLRPTAPEIPDAIGDPKPPRICELNGPTAGREIPLLKPLTTLGKSGIHVSMIVRRKSEYYLTFVEGAAKLKVNDKMLDTEPYQLAHGDLFFIDGIQLQFLSG